MESIYKGLLQRSLLPHLRCIRNKHKHNITKPRLPHFERHVVEQVCVPYFLQKAKPKHVPDIDSCNNQVVLTTDLTTKPIIDILAKEAVDKIKSSKLIGFFQLNTYNNEDIFDFRVLLKKNGMKYVYYKKCIITKALTGTYYEPFLQLFKGPTVMATSTESTELSKLLNISKNIEKFILMAGFFEDRLLSYSELKYYGEYKNLNAARVNLVHFLNLSSQNFVQKINQHSNTLVQCLNQRVENMKKCKEAS